MTTPTVQVESRIAYRLREPTLFDGITTAEERRERVRQLIERRQLHMAIAGRSPSGKTETWAELFARVYGEPVTP